MALNVRHVVLWLVILVAMIGLFQVFDRKTSAEKELVYSDFLSMAEKGQIASVTIRNQNVSVKSTDGRSFHTFAPRDENMVSTLKASGVRIEARPENESHWKLILYNWLPLLVLIGVWIFFMRQMQSGGGKALSFGKSRARLMTEQSGKVTFADVAGVDEAKEELSEIVEFLRDPRRFTRLGGRIPKGVLLMGAPGSGKTLMARAIAGEAEVHFFAISGSDFVEMFVGVGASRVRDLFIQGKKHAPCIIFIDEIDAVGRHRGAGLGGGHDEREQTLNQLLVEMDGFESNEGVILIAATNRPDVLDPALLRPGRFDRQVVVPLPDINGREKILAVHMKKTPVDADVDTHLLARGTPGFSGADLENLVNEAALLAAKGGKDKLTMADFEEAKDKVSMGLARKSKVFSEEDRRAIATHEGGHALVARFLADAHPVNKVTIIPRGRALGVTLMMPDERDLTYREHLSAELAVFMGGRAAEEIVFGKMSTGASSDIKHATEIAQRMVRDWGMSKALGPLSYSHGEGDQIFLGREISRPRDYSETTAQAIDEEVHGIIMEAYGTARAILTENRDILDRLTDLLIEKETIMGSEMDTVILSLRPELPHKNRHHPNPKVDEPPRNA
ncbi:MAG: ATP-dependent metallopeptidase FtsH/Yme1/Tma family protein [Deltaproteobacteria bacterium]|nr:ATP-dependent metallopeptidase FtsH/Yme1/Tma family protein [Deltaproteobacteria bacterium]